MTRPFRVVSLPRFAVMGVVNVTPDSFSDGGRYLEPEPAVAHALALIEQGAAVIDVGGESTRPGADPVDADTEIARTAPVIEQIVEAAPDAVVSIDTVKAVVAEAAIARGAQIVNDVSAGLSDPGMIEVVAGHDAGFVAMHMQGTPATMQHEPRYHDVVAEVADHLAARVAAAQSAGVRGDAILVDPGIGFGKTYDHNLALLAALPTIASRAGAPLLVGASRKSFLGAILDGRPPAERDDGTLATTVWVFDRGARVVRVHDVAGSARAARFLDVIGRAGVDGVRPDNRAHPDLGSAAGGVAA